MVTSNNVLSVHTKLPVYVCVLAQPFHGVVMAYIGMDYLPLAYVIIMAYIGMASIPLAYVHLACCHRWHRHEDL